ncbi:MAG: hypothetical protein ABIA62_00905 [Candidatus Woesearchaeota archaeon]
MTSSAAFGFSIWTEPSELNIKEIHVGTKTYYSLEIHSDSEEDVSLHLSIGGPAEDILSIEQQMITARSGTPARVRMMIDPEDTPSGEYAGFLIITTGSDPQMATTFMTSETIRIRLHLTEDELISAGLKDTTVPDRFKEDLFTIKTILRNTGNSPIEPTITVEIIDKDGVNVRRFVRTEDGLIPGEDRQVIYDEMIGLSPGNYTAIVALSTSEMVFEKDLLKFRITETKEEAVSEEVITLEEFGESVNDPVTLSAAPVFLVSVVVLLVFIRFWIKKTQRKEDSKRNKSRTQKQKK